VKKWTFRGIKHTKHWHRHRRRHRRLFVVVVVLVRRHLSRSCHRGTFRGIKHTKHRHRRRHRRLFVVVVVIVVLVRRRLSRSRHRGGGGASLIEVEGKRRKDGRKDSRRVRGTRRRKSVTIVNYQTSQNTTASAAMESSAQTAQT
jgi:hypothetical protein